MKIITPNDYTTNEISMNGTEHLVVVKNNELIIDNSPMGLFVDDPTICDYGQSLYKDNEEYCFLFKKYTDENEDLIRYIMKVLLVINTMTT